MINARSIATLGVGFGALAIATVGFLSSDVVEVPVAQAQAQAGGYSSGYAGVSRHKKTLPVKQSPQVALDALIRDEDDMMLHIIMNAVTKGML